MLANFSLYDLFVFSFVQLVLTTVLVLSPARDIGTRFRWYDRREVLGLLEPLELPFSIAAQSRLKRSINRRYDIVVYKDDSRREELARFHMLRQQEPIADKRPNRSLSDFIARNVQ